MRGTSAEAQGHPLGAWPAGLSAPRLGLACSCLWRNHSASGEGRWERSGLCLSRKSLYFLFFWCEAATSESGKLF